MLPWMTELTCFCNRTPRATGLSDACNNLSLWRVHPLTSEVEKLKQRPHRVWRYGDESEVFSLTAMDYRSRVVERNRR